VTNPPLDAIREELVTSVVTTIGPESNLLDPHPNRAIRSSFPAHPHRRGDGPFRVLEHAGFTSRVFPILWDPRGGEKAWTRRWKPSARKSPRRWPRGSRSSSSPTGVSRSAKPRSRVF
jgi:hypothetical protein